MTAAQRSGYTVETHTYPPITSDSVRRMSWPDLILIVSDEDGVSRYYNDTQLWLVIKELQRRAQKKGIRVKFVEQATPQSIRRYAGPYRGVKPSTQARMRQWIQTKEAQKPQAKVITKATKTVLQAQQQKRDDKAEWRISAQRLKLSEVKAYYYSKRVQILRYLKLHNIAIKLFPKRGKGKPIFIRHPRGKPTQWIRIRTWTEMEKWLDQKAVEFYPEINYPDNSLLLPMYVIDLDVPNGVPMKKQKIVVSFLRFLMAQLPEVYRTEISHTGGRGWHIEGKLRKRVHWQKAKARVQKDVIDYIVKIRGRPKEFHWAALTGRMPEISLKIVDWVTQERRKAARGRRIYLDIDVMRPRGVLRAPYCIHAKTGRVKLPIPVQALARFRPRGARTELRRAMYPHRRRKT